MNEHYSVLLNETIDLLNVKPDGIYVDATLGYGGHSEALLKKLCHGGTLYAFDQDKDALIASKRRLIKYQDQITYIHANFRYLKQKLNECGINQIDGMMMDLGVSSVMFDQANRGFSYQLDGMLDMRMNNEDKKSALEVVNDYELEKLIKILKEYGEEEYAYSIAKSIIANRPINTTYKLVEAIKKGLPNKALNKKGHPAKKTFQAIRIEVNDELNALKEGLNQGLEMLRPNGRLACISFHSLEDRIVKQTFKALTIIDAKYKRLPLKESEMPKPKYRLINKNPIMASDKELKENNRSHSAKLRVIERREL